MLILTLLELYRYFSAFIMKYITGEGLKDNVPRLFTVNNRIMPLNSASLLLLHARCTLHEMLITVSSVHALSQFIDRVCQKGMPNIPDSVN